MGYERDGISPQDNSGKNVINSLLERASDEARRILRAVQEAAGTTYCKGVQIRNLKQFAIDNGEYDIFDALPNNVLHGIDNQIYFIDTIIYPTSANNFDIYKSLSPRYTK